MSPADCARRNGNGGAWRHFIGWFVLPDGTTAEQIQTVLDEDLTPVTFTVTRSVVIHVDGRLISLPATVEQDQVCWRCGTTSALKQERENADRTRVGVL